MTLIEFASSAIPIVLAALGTWFLVREVDHAHDFEEMSREMADVKELLVLYKTNSREFWIRSAMRSFNCDRTTAGKMAQDMSDELIQKGIADYKQFYDQKVEKSVLRWYGSTVPAQLKRRRRFLWTGFALIILGAVTQLLVATSKWFAAS